MSQKPSNMESIVLGACALHNLMRTRYPRLTNHLVDHEDPDTYELVMGAWRDEASFQGLAAMRGNNSTRAAKGQRDYMRAYYNSEVGRVPWQENMI